MFWKALCSEARNPSSDFLYAIESFLVVLCILHYLPRHCADLQESNVNLRLTVVSTAGFGDQINKENSAKAVVTYLDQQFEQYITEELKIKRDLVHFHDTRIHVCLYFIAPTGHS